jgi:hypothetical protein
MPTGNKGRIVLAKLGSGTALRMKVDVNRRDRIPGRPGAAAKDRTRKRSRIVMVAGEG